MRSLAVLMGAFFSVAAAAADDPVECPSARACLEQARSALAQKRWGPAEEYAAYALDWAEPRDARLALERTTVSLPRLLDAIKARFGPRAEAEGRRLAIGTAAPETAELDPARIEGALGNLVENALRHGAGEIRVSSRAEGSAAETEEVRSVARQPRSRRSMVAFEVTDNLTVLEISRGAQ